MVNRLLDLVPVAQTASCPRFRPSQPIAPRDADVQAFFTPLHYEPNYAYPLIVWLHGPDDNEGQLRTVLPLISVRNYVAVGPRGTLATVQAGDQTGYRWPQSSEHILLAESRVLRAIAAARRRFHVHPERIVLAGFGCGGTMAVRLALKHADLVAGAASLGGPFPEDHAPLCRWHDRRRLRLLIASGQTSNAYPPEHVCRDLALFHAANMIVHLRHYPCGDELTTEMLADVDRWIMEEFIAARAGVCATADECQP